MTSLACDQFDAVTPLGVDERLQGSLSYRLNQRLVVWERRIHG